MEIFQKGRLLPDHSRLPINTLMLGGRTSDFMELYALELQYIGVYKLFHDNFIDEILNVN